VRKFLGIVALMWLAGPWTPAVGQTDIPDLTGTWACDPSDMLIRDQWTTLTYTLVVSDQRGALMEGAFTWVLPPDTGVTGNQGGKNIYSGTIKVLGVIDWDNTSVDLVAYGDGHRHHGTLVDPDTIRFVHSETGDAAWVSRTICRRQAG
jgi:hypothetical protein